MTINAIDSGPRLTVELVPRTCWFSNVRDRVSREDWDRMRSRVYEHAGSRCEVCGGRGSKHPVECHEVWEYDERTAVQRLVRMIALCPACHEVKHIGLAGIKGRGEIAAKHLAAVNDWTAQLTAQYIDQAFVAWEKRSARTWSLDVSALAAYGIDPLVIAEANEVPAEDRSQTAAVATAEVRSCEVRVIQQSEIDSYIDHLMYES
jgi:hypothetical protein